MDVNNQKNNNQQYGGTVYKDEWSFLNNPSQPPKPPSLLARYKKLFLFVLVPMIIITILAVVYSATKKSSSLPVAQTSVTTTQYDGQYFSMKYPSSLRKDLDEKLEDDSDGWYLSFAEEDYLNSSYKISVKVTNEPPNEEASADILNQVVDQESVQINNLTSSEVNMAGNTTTKYVGDYVSEKGDRSVFYATTLKDNKYITFSGDYVKTNTDITNSLDAILSSITLK